MIRATSSPLRRMPRAHHLRQIFARTLALLLLATAALATARPLAAEGGLPSADTILVASNPLEVVSLLFARGLVEGPDAGLNQSFSSVGIRLHLDDAGHVGLSPRQAVASIREFLSGFEGMEVLVTRVSPVEGSADRGFAEVSWKGTAVGTSHEVHRTLFIGLYRGTGDWKVDEVRFLR